ncbi:MAG: amidophosphoribosyltransferase, partial [Bacillota bacterium]
MSPILPDDFPKEECGVFGVWGCPHAQILTHFGLYALQHRGQESAGIAARVSPQKLALKRDMGLVSEVFTADDIEGLESDAALGHVRYSTAGDSTPENAQPLVVRMKSTSVALAHNGNLINAKSMRRRLEAGGSIFQTNADTEVIAHLAARESEKDLKDSLLSALRQVEGAYALVVLTPDGLYAARDPNGFRPLCLGRIEGGWVVASETCALDAAGAVFIRDLAPGELLSIDDDGMTSLRIGESVGKPSLCIFEYIYFARPDSDIAGLNVHQVRKEMGRYLARDHFVEADVVTGVPDSSISAASGYAEEAGIPYEMGLVRNRYIGRTFIQPKDALRQRGVKLKLNPLRKVVRDRRVVLVDDSVVRGTTSKILVRLLREAGAREIHLRISSPPYRYPCYYGIDTSARGQLIAAERSVEEIRTAVGADSLEYLSVERVAEAAGGMPSDFCVACFMGDYRVGVDSDV